MLSQRFFYLGQASASGYATISPRMKILLINSNRLKHPWPVIPFGLCSVATALDAGGYSVKFLDLCFSKKPKVEIQRTIEFIRPDIIGIGIRNIDNGSGYATNFMLDNIKAEVIEPCKTHHAGPIVIGGSAVGISGAEMLHFFDLSYAIKGDGELAIFDFVKRFEKKMPFNGLEGLIYRRNDVIVEENPPSTITNLDNLPFVSINQYINLDRYRQFGSPLQIQTKRGCPLNCAYCTYSLVEGKIYRLKTPKRVADEIEALVTETGINHLEFTDSTFNIPLSHTKTTLRAIARKNIKLRCRTMGLNPSSVDSELVDLMKQVGFQDVDLGAESGCNKTLLTLGKNYGKKDVIRAGRLLRDRKIPTSWFLLVGAPGETMETLNETFHTVSSEAASWDLVTIGVGIRIYKGSPLAEQMKLDNSVDLDDNFLHPVHYKPDCLSLDTIKIITKYAFLRHPNFLMYDENSQYPALLVKTATVLVKIFAPNQPIWRCYIMIRKLLQFSGYNLIARLIFYVRHRSILSALKK